MDINLSFPGVIADSRVLIHTTLQRAQMLRFRNSITLSVNSVHLDIFANLKSPSLTRRLLRSPRVGIFGFDDFCLLHWPLQPTLIMIIKKFLNPIHDMVRPTL